MMKEQRNNATSISIYWIETENKDGLDKNEELLWHEGEGQGIKLIGNWGLGGGIEFMFVS